jgi:hypothetical protein
VALLLQEVKKLDHHFHIFTRIIIRSLGAAPAAATTEAAKEPEKPKVEEVDALDGGMDMFGGSGGGGDY